MNEEKIVRAIIDAVLISKDRAISKYCEKFDKVKIEPRQFRVTSDEIKKALSLVDNKFLSVLNVAIKNIKKYHEKQKQSVWTDKSVDGVEVGLRIVPVESVGIYVPGGRAAYPSSVLMNAIPAKIAGVKKIVMVTPPGQNKKINPYILAAAHLLGINEIYKVGGAQAIAALAFGTQTIPKVDKIVGPGNIYVTWAKKLLYGTVGIDKLAGPSDILIIADNNANAKFISADMIAQAEHDPYSKAVLVTYSKRILRNVKSIIRSTGFAGQCKFHSVRDIDEAVNLSNKIAPEHLVLNISSYNSILKKIINAGAIFLGAYSPVAIGDYFAGPNHVLPTEGSARFASPLGVYDFVKYQSVIKYNKEALKKIGESVKKLAVAEGLNNHALSIEIRLK